MKTRLFLLSFAALFTLLLSRPGQAEVTPAPPVIRPVQIGADETLSVAAKAANAGLRSGPSIDAQVIAPILETQSYLLLEKKGNWVKVQLFNYASMTTKAVIGWVYGEFFGVEDKAPFHLFNNTSSYIVTRPGAQLQEEPSMRSPGEIQSLPVGDIVYIGSKSGDWLRTPAGKWLYREFAEIRLPLPDASRSLFDFESDGILQWLVACGDQEAQILGFAGPGYSLMRVSMKDGTIYYMLSDANALVWNHFRVTGGTQKPVKSSNAEIEAALKAASPRLFLYNSTAGSTEYRLEKAGCKMSRGGKDIQKS